MVPSWYNPSECGVLRMPNLHRAAESGAIFGKQNGIKKCQKWEDDARPVVLSVIDCQLDFIAPQGALCVPGAVQDTDRLCRFIYNNVGQISHILASIDTHYLFQPFHQCNWIAGTNCDIRQNGTAYQPGDHPDPFTVITTKHIQNDVWRPVRNAARMMEYLEKLEQTGKKNLCIWPFHCILGTPGHSLDPSFMEAVFFHSAARSNQYDATIKGLSPSSEHYGILQAEVPFPNDPTTQLNDQILSKWEKAEIILFAGQAKSHCVIATLNQVVDNFGKRNQNHLIQKMFVLEDCMSSVPDIQLPDGSKIEFNKMANERLEELRGMGVKLVKSTDKIL